MEWKQNPGPGVEAEKVLQVCVAGAIETSHRELTVTPVDAGSITAVIMLKREIGL